MLADSMNITYMTDKEYHRLVPVLIPPDTVPAIKKLATSTLRSLAGVLRSNKFLFASSHSSESHVSGWHAINGICKDLSLVSYEDLIATNNRHRISTLFAALDVPTKDRELFYSYMRENE